MAHDDRRTLELADDSFEMVDGFRDRQSLDRRRIRA
jgi:hypothetical protein